MHLLQTSTVQHIQYSDYYTHWKIWSSNLGRKKRTTKHPDQLQRPPSLQLNENQNFFSGSKVASADSVTTHIHLEATLRISGATPLLNLSVSMAHSGTILFYLYISLQRSHPFCSFKGTLLHITYLLHAHCMTHLFHLHWSNYINIINSSNNKPQYIIFHVLLLLTPSTGQIFSG